MTTEPETPTPQDAVPEDAARRARLAAVMASRAARWCEEQVENVRMSLGEREDVFVPANVAEDLAGWAATNIVRGIYQRGYSVEFLTDQAWEVRALSAWGFLYGLLDREVVPAYCEHRILELEDAADRLPWHLRSGGTS